MNTNNTNNFNNSENFNESNNMTDTSAKWTTPDFASEGVKDFINEFYPQGLVYLNSTFFAYSNGYWARLCESADVRFNITKSLSHNAKTSKVNELLKMLKLTCVVKSSDFKPNMNCICFLNGTLDLTDFKLKPHSPDFHLLSGRHVNWDENAKANTFLKYLEDVFRYDHDCAQKMRFVLEWMGLCLVPDTSFEKFVVCVGEGGNGKSVLLKLMHELLGFDNVYSAPVQRLGNRRSLAELDGKLLLTSSEMNENSVIDDGILKQIVSGDTIEAERKFQAPFTFVPHARIMLATNHLPKLRDVTHAFFRRLVLLKFNRNFTAEEMDMNLSAKLREELSGIFVLAVNSLKSLRERGSFVVPPSSTEACNSYRVESDIVKMFADEILSADDDKGVKPASLYELYKKYCKANGFTPDNNIVFGKRLKQLGFNKKRSNGKDYWCVSMTDASIEILAKQSIKTEKLTPENAPLPESANQSEVRLAA